MYVLQRPEQKGDRSRKKLHTPGEAVEKLFHDGMVVVSVEKVRTRLTLMRFHGFEDVDESTLEPAGDTKPEPATGINDPRIAHLWDDEKTPDENAIAEALAALDDPTTATTDAVDVRRAELKAMTVKTLRKMASKLEIAGRSKMNEDALVQAILTAEE